MDTTLVRDCPYTLEKPGKNRHARSKNENARAFMMPQRYIKIFFTKAGFRAEGVLSAGEAMKAVQGQVYDIVLSDLRLPDTDGLTLLKWIRETSPNSAVFIMTGYADIQTAVQAIRLGAADYLEKPVDPVILREKIDEVLRKKDRPHERIPFIKGESPASLKMYDYMMLVAPTLLSVLISGESGTGKEYVANHIHQNIPRDLASSELFGHLKGSFTSAISDKKGAFEMADGGTLFLDEVGNLSHDVQMQLLRALQEGVIKPVGSSRIIEVNIRIITATNVDLKQMIEQGRFREDLYHRINEFQLHIPRLQERGQDVMLFARHFLEYANRQMNRKITGFTPGAEQLMMAYSWRGNLRELLNVVKRTVLLSEGPEIQATDLPEEVRGFQSVREGQDAHTLKEQHERQMITDALARTRNNRTRAARLLGIDRKTLYNKMKLYNLE